MSGVEMLTVISSFISPQTCNVAAIAHFLTENGNTFVPCILIGLGVFKLTCVVELSKLFIQLNRVRAKIRETGQALVKNLFDFGFFV
jgi:hypothetical protein